LSAGAVSGVTCGLSGNGGARRQRRADTPPDAHFSKGRYYDPSIGRYISPDPYLDAPFSSQRLDRYNFGFNNPLRYKRSEALPDVTVDLARGTVVAAQGLPAAALTSSFGQLAVELEAARWFVKEAFGAAADAGVERVLGGYQVGHIAITASMTKLTRELPHSVQELLPDIPMLKGTGKPQTVRSELVLLRPSVADDLRRFELEQVVKPGRGSSGRWRATVSRKMVPLDLAVSFLLAVGIEMGFSWYEDMQMRDIYGLTDQQMAYRARVRVIGGLLALGAGMLVAGVVSVPFMPAMAVGIVVALAVRAAWDWWAEPRIFNWRGLYGPYEPRPAVMTSANRLQPPSPWR
jgi:RHS repeat-associated protein